MNAQFSVEHAVQGKPEILTQLGKYAKVLMPYWGLIFVTVFFTIVSKGDLLSERNLRTIMNQVIPIMIISVGALFIYAHGGMDISQGGVIGVCGLVSTLYLNNGGSIFGAFLLSMAVALAFGLVGGVVTTIFNLPSFLTAICLMFVGRGIVAYCTANTSSISVKTDLSSIDDLTFKLIITAIIVVIGYMIFQYTKIGKYNKAMGVSMPASEQAGIPTVKYRMYAYLISAATVGVAGFLSLARTNAVSRNTGLGMEMDMLVALMLGGMSSTGGTKSRISNAVLGSLIVVILSNGLILWGVDVLLVQFIKGMIFLMVASLTFTRTKGALPR